MCGICRSPHFQVSTLTGSTVYTHMQLRFTNYNSELEITVGHLIFSLVLTEFDLTSVLVILQ